jgi:arsenate reductase-like glutaredoxin family protein
MVLQTVKKLLSLKADKTELAEKVDRSELPDEYDALEIVAEMNLIEPPIVADDGSIYTDENGDIYTL